MASKGHIEYHDEEYNRLLRSKRWQQLRILVMNQHKWLCAECMKAGRITEAVTVHHITPVQWGKSYQDKARLTFDRKNLIPLCDDCHRKAHLDLGKQTKEGARRRTQYLLEDFKKNFL